MIEYFLNLFKVKAVSKYLVVLLVYMIIKNKAGFKPIGPYQVCARESPEQPNFKVLKRVDDIHNKVA